MVPPKKHNTVSKEKKRKEIGNPQIFFWTELLGINERRKSIRKNYPLHVSFVSSRARANMVLATLATFFGLKVVRDSIKHDLKLAFLFMSTLFT